MRTCGFGSGTVVADKLHFLGGANFELGYVCPPPTNDATTSLKSILSMTDAGSGRSDFGKWLLAIRSVDLSRSHSTLIRSTASLFAPSYLLWLAACLAINLYPQSSAHN